MRVLDFILRRTRSFRKARQTFLGLLTMDERAKFERDGYLWLERSGVWILVKPWPSLNSLCRGAYWSYTNGGRIVKLSGCTFFFAYHTVGTELGLPPHDYAAILYLHAKYSPGFFGYSVNVGYGGLLSPRQKRRKPFKELVKLIKEKHGPIKT